MARPFPRGFGCAGPARGGSGRLDVGSARVPHLFPASPSSPSARLRHDLAPRRGFLTSHCPHALAHPQARASTFPSLPSPRAVALPLGRGDAALRARPRSSRTALPAPRARTFPHEHVRGLGTTTRSWCSGSVDRHFGEGACPLVLTVPPREDRTACWPAARSAASCWRSFRRSPLDACVHVDGIDCLHVRAPAPVRLTTRPRDCRLPIACMESDARMPDHSLRRGSRAAPRRLASACASPLWRSPRPACSRPRSSRARRCAPRGARGVTWPLRVPCASRPTRPKLRRRVLNRLPFSRASPVKARSLTSPVPLSPRHTTGWFGRGGGEPRQGPVFA